MSNRRELRFRPRFFDQTLFFWNVYFGKNSRQSEIARWCNGNTSDFGSDILGSSPSRVT